MSFHPPITDAAEWRTALGQCGCCTPPSCVAPLLACRSVDMTLCCYTGSYLIGGVPYYGIFTTRVDHYSGSTVTGIKTGTWKPAAEAADCLVSETTVGSGSAGPTEYSGQLSCADVMDQLTLAADTLEADDFTTESCLSSYICAPGGASPIVGAQASLHQYCWTISPCHRGSWYLIEWDEVFFPRSYNLWLAAISDESFDPNANPPPALPVMYPKSWEWTGTAVSDCAELTEAEYEARLNDPDRQSPWSNPVIPPQSGTMEIRNVRVRCYRSPYGAVAERIDVTAPYTPLDLDQDGIPDTSEPIDP